MKQIIILLIFSFPILTQHLPKTKTVVRDSSQNGEFEIVTSGFNYEGFYGDLEISLLSSTKDTLWTKILKSQHLGLPSVSNNGIVALSKWPYIQFFSNNGDLIWKYKFSDLYKIHRVGRSSSDMIDCFSEDNKYYYIFLSIGYNSVLLKKIEISKSISKETEFKDFYPSYINSFKNKLVVHDFSFASSGYINKGVLLNESGEVIDSISYDLKNPRHFKKMYLSSNQDTLFFYFKNRDMIKTIKSLYLGDL